MVCFLDCKQKAALWSQQASGLARSRGKAEVCETELNWFWLLPHSHIGSGMYNRSQNGKGLKNLALLQERSICGH